MNDDDIDFIPLVRQRLIRDMLPCDHGYIDVLDVVPASEDVGAVLHAESHARMSAVTSFQPFVDVYVVLTADIMTEVMYKNLKATVPADAATERWHEITQQQNREIVRGAIYPILAHMLEAGLLKQGMNT